MAQEIPPFSPFLFLGMALQPVPFSCAERISAPLLRALARRLEPAVSDRMAGQYGRVAILPAEVSFGLVFTIGAGLEIDLVDKTQDIETEATIHAPLQVLLDLATGSGLDGDGSFFSRELTMEGDTGLCMALRYALEDSGVSPWDMIAEATHLPHSMLFQIEDWVTRLHKKARSDADRFQSSLLSPLLGRVSRLERDFATLREDVQKAAARARRRSEP